MSSEALRIFMKSSARRLFGWKRYSGGVTEICDSVIEDCWNSRDGYYQASAGHFCQFFTRDFGIASRSLLECRDGRMRGLRTVEYALSRFMKCGRITAAITPSGKPFDFPCYAVDSLPWFLHAARVFNARKLLFDNYDFIISEIERWGKRVLGSDGFVKRRLHYSGMRDHAIRSSCAYDNTMVLLLRKEAAALGISVSMQLSKRLFIEQFWNNAYFRDEPQNDVLSGDANVLPFWTGIIDDKSKAQSVLGALHDAGLDKVLPLAYSESRSKSPRMIPEERYVRDWETTARWMQLGMMYAAVARDCGLYDLYKDALSKLAGVVKRDKNVLEVYRPDGRPYKSLFYYSDEGMLWGAALMKGLLESRA